MKKQISKLFKNLSETYFYVCSILFVIVSFTRLGEDRFWDLMGMAIIFSGIQEIINYLKVDSNGKAD